MSRSREAIGHFPLIGAAVWVALLATAPLRKPDWSLLPETFKGTVFLLSLVTIASMMPVDKLPPASWHSAMGLGFISAAFDNIPLTALALQQGGYDWGMLAYAVGFGGSMIWFGSSAGVALSNVFPEAKSVGGWIRDGWHVPVAYVIGFFVLLALLGWHPSSHPPDVTQAPTESARRAAPDFRLRLESGLEPHAAAQFVGREAVGARKAAVVDEAGHRARELR